MHVRTMIAREVTMAMFFVLLCAPLAACGLNSAAGNTSGGNTSTEGPLPTAFPAVWQLSQAAPRGVLDYTFASSDPRMGYACTTAGGTLTVFVTPDGGASWKSTAPLPDGAGTYCQLFVDDTDAANLILGRGAADAQTGIQIVAPRLLYRSRDGGRTWTALPGLPAIEGSDSRNTIDGVAILGERVLATVRLDTSPSPTAIGAPTYALYALQADGHGWTRIDQAFTAQGLVAGGLLEAGTAVLVSAYPVATSPRASASSDSMGQQSIAGVPSSPLSSFSGPVAGAQIWRSTDGGSTWERVAIASTHPALFGFLRARGGATFYGVGIDHGSSDHRTSGLLYSSDGGASWSELPGATSLRDRSGQMLTMSGSSNMIGVA
ncbi:MAG TPA: sialidase family protein, partial [Ktedonobacterales bacterium]